MVNSSGVPAHIGYIVDGNRRWAKKQGLQAYEGHQRGYEVLESIVKSTFSRGVKYVSAYVFSTENWQRSENEVNKILSLFMRALTKDLDKLGEVQIRFAGAREQISEALQGKMRTLEQKTAHFNDKVFVICFNYGGKQELVDAFKKMLHDSVAADAITPALIDNYVYAPDVPPVDMIVRTSGESRLSNFMLWRSAYSELLFLEKYWPDMTDSDVEMCLDEFAKRTRRFGE
ncbi:di-trans,poly-cis-decaprenylcistransferase [Candidatus Saccharibacteria bacterium]|nr:di-trans,poly-cis-decaprenylcistransferase [Candidatus Saccharibacteria bacterium]